MLTFIYKKRKKSNLILNGNRTRKNEQEKVVVLILTKLTIKYTS